MNKAPGFQKFWSVLPSDIQREILQELTYTIIKSNKPIFTQGGAAKCFHFILKGSAFALQASKDTAIRGKMKYKSLKSQFESLPNFDNDESQEIPSRLFLMPEDSPASGVYKFVHGGFSSMTSIPNSNTENTTVMELEQGECFGEIVSDFYSPKSVTMIAKETCHLAVLSLSVFRRIRKNYKTKIETEKLDFIRNLSLVKDWSEAELLRLYDQGKTVNFIRNQVVYDIGDSLDSVYLIKSGEFEMTKEKRLNIADEEVFDKRSVEKQNVDIDRCRLSILNPIWKKRFSTAKKLKVKDALLGVGQNFGEDEVIQKETVRKSRVVVKSLAAEVLVIPLEKILTAEIEENEQEESVTSNEKLNGPKESRAESKNTIGSQTLIPSMHLLINLEQKEYDSDDNTKEPVVNFASHRVQFSKAHQRSTSFTSLTPRSKTLIKIKSNNNTPRNNPSLVNKLGFSLVDQALEAKDSPKAVPKDFVPNKSKTITLNTTKVARITSKTRAPSINELEGMNRLWERNVQQYYPKEKKKRNKSMGQSDLPSQSHRNVVTSIPGIRDKNPMMQSTTEYLTPKKNSVPTIKHMNSSLGFITAPQNEKQVWTPISSEKQTPIKAFHRNLSQSREDMSHQVRRANQLRETLYKRLGISKGSDGSPSSGSNSSDCKSSPYTEGFDRVLSGASLASQDSQKKLSNCLEGSRSPNMSIKASQFKQRVLREPFKPFQPEPLKKSLTIIDMGNCLRGLNQ